jgi:hypothetical protein
MPVPRHGSPADKRSAEIGHLRDKGYPLKRAAAAAYNMYGEEEEACEGEYGCNPLSTREDSADAASPRFDEKTLRGLLEKCRRAREARAR